MTRTTPFPLRFLVWPAVGLGLTLVAAANWHLVHVAINSQPDCVVHLRAGDRRAQPEMLSAARSSCTSPTTRTGRDE